jgi:hypothetical protein
MFIDGPISPLNGMKDHTDRVRKFMNTELGQERLFKRIDISKPPYSTQYPYLIGLYEGTNRLITTHTHSYFVRGDFSEFEDPYAMNFALREDSRVYRDIKGFKPLPVDKMGLYLDAWRKQVPMGKNSFGDVDVMDAKKPEDIQINFQPSSIKTPKRWHKDTGEVFGIRKNGYAYGWTPRCNKRSAEARGVHEDVLLDSLVQFYAGSRWEIAVENGTYLLEISIGDAAVPCESATLYVEDVRLQKSKNLEANEYLLLKREVEVKDGRLTLFANTQARSKYLVGLNTIKITKK